MEELVNNINIYQDSNFFGEFIAYINIQTLG